MEEKYYKDMQRRIISIETLLKQLIAVESVKYGVGQVAVGKRLGVATGTINKWVKGIKPSK